MYAPQDATVLSEGTRPEGEGACRSYNFFLICARVGSGKFAFFVPIWCLYGVFFINFEFLIFNFELFFVPLHRNGTIYTTV